MLTKREVVNHTKATLSTLTVYSNCVSCENILSTTKNINICNVHKISFIYLYMQLAEVQKPHPTSLTLSAYLSLCYIHICRRTEDRVSASIYLYHKTDGFPKWNKNTLLTTNRRYYQLDHYTRRYLYYTFIRRINLKASVYMCCKWYEMVGYFMLPRHDSKRFLMVFRVAVWCLVFLSKKCV